MFQVLKIIVESKFFIQELCKSMYDSVLHSFRSFPDVQTIHVLFVRLFRLYFFPEQFWCVRQSMCHTYCFKILLGSKKSENTYTRHLNNLPVHTLIQVHLINPYTYIRYTFTEGSFNNTTCISYIKSKLLQF